jgi:hypothetical protein
MRTRQGFLGAMAGLSMIGSVLAATVLPMTGRKDALNDGPRAAAVTIDAPSERNQDGKLSATTDRRDQEGTGITTGSVSHEVASVDFEVEASVHGEPRSAVARDNGRDDFFRPSLQPGQVLTDFFSRTFSIEGEGIERSVRRDSGTGSYTVIANARNGDLKFSLVYDMEGIASGKAEGEFRDQGRTQCLLQNCGVSENASALVYDARFWGSPKATIRAGTSWEVTLPASWELGPPGRQTVTVLSVDRANKMIMLKRVGEGEGAYLGDRAPVEIKKDGKSYRVSVTGGRSHWEGRTVFMSGVVISDELLVDRPIILSSPDVGSIKAHERVYMLTNLAP